MSEIEMLSLFRCCSEEDMQEDSQDDTNAKYFVTDYFDGIKVEKLDLEKITFSECMGIKQDANKKKGVSHQRYCLYSEIETKTEEKDVFRMCEEYPILTVIQLFINPDVYQAEKFEDEQELSAENWMNKLENCISSWRDSSNLSKEIKWKIYQLVSAGDLAIIVRSKKVHAAYDLCSLVRSIRLVIDNKGKEEAAFYSYSICGVLDYNPSEVGAENCVEWKNYLEEGDQVVIRIQYAQTFRQQSTENLALKNKLLQNGSHLFGRYDHQIFCNPEEFQELYPYLKKYKFGPINISEDKIKKISSPKVCMLLEMMKKKYISYANERLLLNYSNDPPLDGTNISAEKWKLKCEGTWESLYERNSNKIEEIRKDVEGLEEKISPYYQSARNLKEYIRLSRRLCRILYEINKLQELRISVANLLAQYKDMIDSLMGILDEIESDHPRVYADTLEENLRHGIGALEIFTRYIRNVNLQTFQTPNYDLQTNMCVEKILLAYSQFLRPFMRRRKKPYYLTEDLYPIIVPSMRVRDLSVMTVFGGRYADGSENQREKLMVVYSPTFSFLCESCFLIPAVFHEIAHQFRYEERSERNDCLKRYVLKTFLHGVIFNILDESEEYNLQNMYVVEKLVDFAYEDFSRLVGEKEKDLCLQEFKQVLAEKLELFCKCASEEDMNYSEQAKRYVAKTKGDIQKHDEEILKALSRLTEEIEATKATEAAIMKGTKGADAKKLKDQREAVENAVKGLKRVQEEQILKEIITELKKAGEEKLKTNYTKLLEQRSQKECESEEIGKQAFDIWNGYIKNHEKEKSLGKGLNRGRVTHLLKQYHNINSSYSLFIHGMKSGYTDEDKIEVLKCWKIFKDMCDHLLEKSEKFLEEFSDKRYEELDWNMHIVPAERLNYITKEIRLEDKEGLRKRVQAICEKYWLGGIYNFISQKIELYREITSDLFMCAVMNLDFFGYLVVAAQMLKFTESNIDIQMERVSVILQCLCASEGTEELNKENWKQSLEKRMEEETGILYDGLCEILETDWMEKHSRPETMKDVLDSLEEFSKETNLTSTRKWIIRIYRQIAVVISKAVRNEVSKDIIGTKEMWKDITSENAYYSQREKFKEILNETGGMELCLSIKKILNSPAKFFVKKKALLSQEIPFILSQYEKSCREIFQK